MATILVVDDEPIVRRLLRLTLEREGHEVLEADEGVAALALADLYHPDLMLLDVALPRMSGLEVARMLPGSTPVLLLTGLAPQPESDAYAPVICGFVEKPFHPAELAGKVREILEHTPSEPSEPAPAA